MTKGSALDEALNTLNTKEVRFETLKKICTTFFGEPRIKGSHHVFKTPWEGEPRINIQKDGKNAKFYQVKQVRESLEKLRTI
jgi:hypothetical protein